MVMARNLDRSLDFCLNNDEGPCCDGYGLLNSESPAKEDFEDSFRTFRVLVSK